MVSKMKNKVNGFLEVMELNGSDSSKGKSNRTAQLVLFLWVLFSTN